MERYIYQFYKGGVVEKLGHANHTETNEQLLIFKDKDGRLEAMPSKKFYEVIDNDFYRGPRYKFLGGF